MVLSTCGAHDYMSHHVCVLRCPYCFLFASLPSSKSARFHFCSHTEADCSEFCSPEARDNRLLWGRDANNNEICLWNTSISVSNNSLLGGAQGGSAGWTSFRQSRANLSFSLAWRVALHGIGGLIFRMVVHNACPSITLIGVSLNPSRVGTLGAQDVTR